jgi:iron complex outermembrane receptor protein
MKTHLFSVSAAALAVLLAGTAARAQDAAPAAQSGGMFQQRGAIDTVIVETQKREESVQDVPIPVTAFSGLAIEKRFAINLSDINKLAPGVQVESVGLFHNASAVTIRGITTSGIESFDDPHTALFVDGVYQARNAWALSNLLDVEAVELLRGPQGTIYGRNAYSGAIIVRTNKPDTADFGGKASIRFANAGNVVVDLIGNMPVVQDKFAIRLATQYYKHDGFYKNNGIVVDGIVDGQTVTSIDEDLKGTRIQGNKYVYFRPSFRFTPNDALDVTLTTEFIRQRGDGTVSLNALYDPRTPSNPLCGGVGTPTAFNCNTSLFEVFYPPNGLAKNPFGDGLTGDKGDGSDPYEVGYNLPAGNDSNLNSYNVTLNADYTTDFGTFTLTGNYGWQRSKINTDTDGTNIDFFASTRYEDYETYQFETHFVSDFSDTVDMIAGLFYLWDTYQVGQLLWTPGIGPFTLNNAGMAFFQNGQERKTWAAYTQFEYHLTDRLSAVAGVRYSWEKKYNVFQVPNSTVVAQGICPASGCTSTPDWSKFPTGPNTVLNGPIEDTWDNWSPRVGVNYRATDDVMLFAFWQRAFKSGGFVNNASTVSTFNDPYGQERIDNFEVGFKSEWLDNRLQINGNIYYQKLNGLQRQIIRPADNTTGQETFITNAADARSYGFELEVLAIPVDGLTLNANLAYNNIKYTSYCADLDGPENSPTPASGRAVCGDVIEVTPGKFIAETDYTDLRLSFAPRWIANFGWTYDMPLGNMGNLSFGASANYTSRMAVTAVPEFPRTDRRSLFLIDAQVSWEHPDGRYRVSVWGKNLNNDIERLSVTPVAFLFAFENPTRPRTYGITLTADF